jgi:hypothetical protein
MTGSYITIPPGPARQCTRCGALGTHYLTCPVLQLPRGYRVSQDPTMSTPVTTGQQCLLTRRPAADDVSSAEAAIYRLHGETGAARPGRSARG